jgi:hypothetical protein
VSARITAGHPIEKLQLSSAVMAALTEENDLEGLGAQVDVEEITLYSDMPENFFVHWANSDN